MRHARRHPHHHGSPHGVRVPARYRHHRIRHLNVTVGRLRGSAQLGAEEPKDNTRQFTRAAGHDSFYRNVANQGISMFHGDGVQAKVNAMRCSTEAKAVVDQMGPTDRAMHLSGRPLPGGAGGTPIGYRVDSHQQACIPCYSNLGAALRQAIRLARSYTVPNAQGTHKSVLTYGFQIMLRCGLMSLSRLQHAIGRRTTRLSTSNTNGLVRLKTNKVGDVIALGQYYCIPSREMI